MVNDSVRECRLTCNVMQVTRVHMTLKQQQNATKECATRTKGTRSINPSFSNANNNMRPSSQNLMFLPKTLS